MTDSTVKHHRKEESLLRKQEFGKRQTHFGLVERKERGRATLALGRRGRGQRCARLL